MGTTAPSVEARATIERDLEGVRRLAKLAGACKRRISKRPPGVRRSEAARYAFILSLAEIYAVTFGQQPKATRDGPWCRFLAAVLSYAEGKHIDSDDAHPIWLRVRNWKESFLEFMIAEMASTMADPPPDLTDE